MNCKKLVGRLWIFLSFFPSTCAITLIPSKEIELIGWQVWQNESSRNLKKLLAWNNGEEGPSVGIAHFTWYPANSSRPNAGTFPELVEFLKKNGHPLPKELGHLKETKTFYAPWSSRQEFLAQLYSPRTQALRHYLLSTIALQMKFIAQRTENALPILMRVARKNQQEEHVIYQFKRLLSTAQGRYAAVDFINLSGEGGFYTVLVNLHGKSSTDAVKEFCTVAQSVLTKQAHRSLNNQARHWLPGWKNRINTYLYFGQYK